MANLIIKASADDLVLKGSGQTGSDTAITVGATGNTTLAGTANNLGTVTAGTIASGATIATGVHGKYFLKDFDSYTYTTAVSLTNNINEYAYNISGANSVNITTGSSTSDLVEFSMFNKTERSNNYIGHGIERDSNSTFNSGNKITVFATGTHAAGSGSNQGDEYEIYSPNLVDTVANWGLSANTQYYFRAIAQTHSVTGTMNFNVNIGNSSRDGLRLSVKLWTLVP